jgi:hypothetical protein
MPQATEQQQQDWMAKRWRPAMGWLYMAVCAFDFIIAPILWSITQAYYHIVPFVQWQPLTLQGAGLFHIAMGAVLGIAAYGRTKEKMAGAENSGYRTETDFSQGFGSGTTYVPPNATTVNNINQGSGFNNGSMPVSGSPSYTPPVAPAFGSPAPTSPTTGKPSGPALSFPVL